MTWVVRGIPVLLMTGTALGCSRYGARGQPLYATVGPRPPENQVAQLRGFVGSVDGRDLTGEGDRFELIPECHVVGTPLSYDDSDDEMLVIEKGLPLYYAMSMKPGHRYVIVKRQSEFSNQLVRIRIIAQEQDSQGRVIREFSQLSREQANAECGID